MEPNINVKHSLKSRAHTATAIFRSIISDLISLIRDNKANFLFLLLFLLTPFAYELLDFFIDIKAYNNYLETNKKYLVLSDYLTVYLQTSLGILHNPQSILGVVSAYFYTFGFLLLSATAFVMLLITIMRKKEYRRREPYVYIAIVLIMFVIDVAGYFLFPTAPPVRVVKDLFYRFSVFPYGDSLVAIKYNSIPSGHIYALTVPFIVAKAENYKNWKRLFGVGLIVTSWVVLTTGDHYAIDVFSAYFLCILLFTIFTTFYDYYNSNSVKVPRAIIIKRIRSLLLTLIALIILSIVTLKYVNDVFLIIQVLCVIVVWPIIVFTTNTDGLLNGDEAINRSLWTDLKDGYYSIKKIFKNQTLNSNVTK